MFNRGRESCAHRNRLTARADLAAKGRWDNEGGAAPIVAVAPATALAELGCAGAMVESAPPSTDSSPVIDDRQDELMTQASCEGRPPARHGRMIVWRWFGVGGVLIIAAITAGVVILDVGPRSIVVGIGLMLLLLLGASPVLAAGLLRGREERAARRIARRERDESRSR